LTVVRSKFDRIANDLYETPEWVTRALLRHVKIAPGMSVWEPAAGNHKIADVLRETGAKVLTSDFATYDRAHDEIFDFVNSDRIAEYEAASAIVTNPPYGPQNALAAKFARLALQRCVGIVALLLTAKFDFGGTRRDLFADNPRFVAKIALTDRIQWFEGEHDNTESHAWYVWGPSIGPTGGARLLYAGRDR
jgi:hypothetical protein